MNYRHQNLLHDMSIDLDIRIPDEKERREFLRALVGKSWGKLPVWSTLDRPNIEDVQKATVGSGAALRYLNASHQSTFFMLVAGDHYKNGSGKLMLPGGFMNLTNTPGSSFVKPSDAPESPRIALARECEEEIKTGSGEPVLRFKPERFKPMDMNTIKLPSGETRIVLESVYDLDDEEFETVYQHVKQINADVEYRELCASHTINDDTGLPEVASMRVTKMNEILKGEVELLHKDQLNLFKRISEQ